MSKWKYGSCPKCGSSDALGHSEGDTWGHCFSCGKDSPLDGKPMKKAKEKAHVTKTTSLEDIAEFESRGFEERGITRAVSEHYGVVVSYNEDGTFGSHYYPYTKSNEIVAYKERVLPKTFTIHGNFKGVELFGQNVAGAGGKRLVITEGELDALAVSQAQFDKYGKFYPVVAITSASNTSTLLEQREWLRNFEEIVLMFDSDAPGQEATEKAAKIIGFDKVKIAKLPEKDPCDVLVKHGSEALMKAVFDASWYNPAGIVRGQEIWNKFEERNKIPSLPYPDCMGGLNQKLRGLRLGDIVLMTSGTGAGKSTVSKEIVLNIHEKTEDMIGIVSLEESIADTTEKFLSMELRQNLDEKPASDKKLKGAFDKVFGDERIMLLDHQGSVSDESLTDKIEYLALLGCKYVVLDHITIAVSEGANGKTGNEAIDYVMSELLKIVKKHNICLIIISHLRKGEKPFEEGHLPSVDDIKGSGSIKQISFDIIAFARNMVSEDETLKNTIKFRVLKCRRTGKTGDAGSAFYNANTCRLEQNDFNVSA